MIFESTYLIYTFDCMFFFFFLSFCSFGRVLLAKWRKKTSRRTITWALHFDLNRFVCNFAGGVNGVMKNVVVEFQ